jgi:hypothetical protein
MVPYGEALRILAGADLQLLLAYGDETGYVPAKVFDYLLSGRPILCIARPSSLTALVEETGTGRWAEPDQVETIADTIAAATRRSGEVGIAHFNAAAIDRFSAPRTSAELARVFDDILAARRSAKPPSR